MKTQYFLLVKMVALRSMARFLDTILVNMRAPKKRRVRQVLLSCSMNQKVKMNIGVVIIL